MGKLENQNSDSLCKKCCHLLAMFPWGSPALQCNQCVTYKLSDLCNEISSMKRLCYGCYSKVRINLRLISLVYT